MRITRICLLLSAMLLVAFLFGCGGGSSSDDNEFLTDAENDVRVGRDITRCGVFEIDEARITEIQAMLGAASTSNRLVAQLLRPAGTVTVPTIFHVVASGPSGAEGNVSDEQLQQQLNVLNSGFTGTAFRFELRGITRTIDPSLVDMRIGSQAEARAKQMLRQGDAATLNVYVAALSDGVLGYAYFPWDFAAQPGLDGVVLQFETLPGGSLEPYNLGETLVHEVGHWLGLLHTFQGQCGQQGDLTDDTPPERIPAYGCAVGRDTCPGDGLTDPVNNFMDYSDDFCLMEFSPQQVDRMDDAALFFRQL